MFLWYIEWAAQDRRHEFGVPDSADWQAKLIADATPTAVEPPVPEKSQAAPKPPLKRAG
jgi:hypothetical protein